MTIERLRQLRDAGLITYEEDDILNEYDAITFVIGDMQE